MKSLKNEMYIKQYPEIVEFYKKNNINDIDTEKLDLNSRGIDD